jgi:hypothetical protein
MTDGDNFVLGFGNGSSASTTLSRSGGGSADALVVVNSSGHAIVGSGTGFGILGRGQVVGVRGESTESVAVLGVSTRETGVRGASDEATGVEGRGPVRGVWGVSVQGIGVRGFSARESGVSGGGAKSGVNGECFRSRGGTGDGVVGQSDTTSVSSGVFGQHFGSGFGVTGRSNNSTSAGPQGVGVLGLGTQRAIGVAGRASGGGVLGTTPDPSAQGGRNDAGGVSVGGLGLGTAGAVEGNNINVGPGVLGFSDRGFGGVFIGPSGVPNAGGLRVVGPVLKTQGEYTEAVPHPDGSQRLMYAPLSPESWYEDFGRGKLVEGRADVQLDPDFVAVLGIEDDSYHVFLTPEADTNGLYVASRSRTGFQVAEQGGGASTLAFSYRVVSRRREHMPERLAKLSEPLEPPKPRELPSHARELLDRIAETDWEKGRARPEDAATGEGSTPG